MEIKKTYEALSDDIICQHKVEDTGGAFFHNHDGYELLLLLDGDINYFIEGEGMHLERGYLMCVSPYTYHRRELVKPGIYDRILINVNYYVMKRLSTEKTDLSECFSRLPTGKFNLIQLNEDEISKYSHLAHCLSQMLVSNEYGKDVLIDVYIKQILVMLNQKNKMNCKSNTVITNIMPSLIAETIAYIEQNITGEITLDIISAHLYHNGTYISRCFKNITGISLQQYIISKRVTLAKQYLRDGYSPCDACFMSGFNDYSNFSRTFAKQEGLSPKKYQLINK